MSETKKITVDIVTGKQKKDPSKEWKAVRLQIGDWSQLIFPRTKFEMDHIEEVINSRS